MSQTGVAQPNPSSSRKKASIIAERFKTRLCKTYRKSGHCVYAGHCMFAHGKEDLRTTERNVADGLVTEAAVKNWQKDQLRSAKQQRLVPQVPPVKAVASTGCITEHRASLRQRCDATSELVYYPRSESSLRSRPQQAASVDPLVAAFTSAPSSSLLIPTAASGSFRHDPYAQLSEWQPLLESASDSAESMLRVEAFERFGAVPSVTAVLMP